MKNKHQDVFSAKNVTQGSKARLLQLNSKTSCPPRGAVPVNQERGWELFTQHFQTLPHLARDDAAVGFTDLIQDHKRSGDPLERFKRAIGDEQRRWPCVNPCDGCFF